MKFVEPIYEKETIHRFRCELAQLPNGERNLLMFEITLATAFRIQDTLDLRKKDVKRGVIKKKIRKTGRETHLELHPNLLSRIGHYIEYLKDDDLLFPITRVQAYRVLKQVADKLGIERFGTHSIRKTKAYHFYIDSGFNLSGTTQLLGHKDSSQVLSYIGWTKKQLSDSVKSHVL